MFNDLFEKVINYKFFRYCIVGVLNTVMYNLVMWVLLQKKYLNIEWSTFIAFIVSISLQFSLNKKFTFNSKIFSRAEVFKYMVMVLINYSISVSCLKLLINFYQFQIELALLINVLILTITGFVISNFWVFKKNEEL